MLQHSPKSLLCLDGAEQFTRWAAHAKSHVAWCCLSCPWSWRGSTGTREAVRRLLPPSHFCHDHSALLPAPGKWRGQRERPQGLDQTLHPVPVAADSAAATGAFKLSPLLAMADRLLAAVAPISSCPWHCQGAFSSSNLLLLPESHLWNGRQPRHYPQDPHLGCPTGFSLKTPTSDLLAASVRPRELHDCRFCSRRTSSLKHSACSDAGWNS